MRSPSDPKYLIEEVRERLSAWADNAEHALIRCGVADEQKWRNERDNYLQLVSKLDLYLLKTQ